MIHEASAMTVRKQFGEILNGVSYRHDSVVITKAGQPVAALVDMELFEKIRQLKEHFLKLTKVLGKTYENEKVEIAEAEIAEAITQVRKNKKHARRS